ncbi:ATP-binding protein [Arthrobacter sp. AQ5-05]|uniref:ATP-binding protein n=1 Tax=Arthrobacter sp. AQ5-05 TaxID=2184581 RepID=UPI0018A7A31A|nr:ATP-binding protein [Arthrobacter sp. AQ5-05]
MTVPFATGRLPQCARNRRRAHPDVPVIIDLWLDELCSIRPVVLVIDDLQWADLSTLDVLMYLIAGPPDRRLAVIATLRKGEPGGGNRLRS